MKYFYKKYGKRIFDLCCVIPGLILILPLLLLLSFLVYFKLGYPILFMQKRPGLNFNSFTIYKFRTMKKLYDNNGNLLSDEERLTPLGHFLRVTSLDELPELFNVLKGDMSLVGPRPLLMEYIKWYDKEQIQRQEVRPGITGWAQINGRNLINWEEKFKLDIFYVNNLSLFFDLKILLITVKIIIQQKGISHKGYLTMPKFTGNK